MVSALWVFSPEDGQMDRRWWQRGLVLHSRGITVPRSTEGYGSQLRAGGASGSGSRRRWPRVGQVEWARQGLQAPLFLQLPLSPARSVFHETTLAFCSNVDGVTAAQVEMPFAGMGCFKTPVKSVYTASALLASQNVET